jgi:hypothetical protein
MKPPAQDPPGPDDARDEYLAGALEQCLGETTTGGAPTAADPEVDHLRPVADLLRRLNDYLRSDPVAGHFWSHLPAGSDPPGVQGQVGKYRVLRSLGAGGQAQTLLGLDPDLNRQVVLKLYHDRRPAVQEAVLREGQALARVRSPHVAGCFGVERHDGMPFLVMEYVPGRSLAEELAAGPLGVAEAVGLARQLAEGLAAVHACGLLHRDLKPANALIGRDGAARLVDFGLSVFLGQPAPGEVAGTLAYMAPEQAAGEADRIDPRTDVYGLGAVLYALLTGRAPHAGASVAQILEAARAGRVTPPAELRPRLPAAVNAVCLRCLAADPGQRFASATALAEALGRCLGARRRAWRWWAAAAALALAVGTLAAWVDARFLHGPAAAPAVSAGWHPDGRLLRRDFALHVALPGGTPRPDGVVVLRADDRLRLTLEASRDCHAAIFWVDAAGRTTCLFPNPEEADNRLEAGRPRRFPAPPAAGKGRTRAIKLSPTGGVEYLHVIASTQPWQPPEATRDGLFSVFDAAAQGRLRDAIRGLEWVDDAPESSRPLVTEQVVPFVVEKES